MWRSVPWAGPLPVSAWDAQGLGSDDRHGGHHVRMVDESGLDFPTTRALVRLRFALEHAIQLARNSSEPGAHVALIALDGACEFALWLVAQTYGVPLRERASREELLKEVRTRLNSRPDGKGWQPAGGAGVNQMHRARNDAQHAAVRFDVSQLSDWSDAARAFIDGLVDAAFGHPLGDVALADAVRDAALADLLRRAAVDIEGACAVSVGEVRAS